MVKKHLVVGPLLQGAALLSLAKNLFKEREKFLGK
jgi:hypothetical protein